MDCGRFTCWLALKLWLRQLLRLSCVFVRESTDPGLVTSVAVLQPTFSLMFVLLACLVLLILTHFAAWNWYHRKIDIFAQNSERSRKKRVFCLLFFLQLFIYKFTRKTHLVENGKDKLIMTAARKYQKRWKMDNWQKEGELHRKRSIRYFTKWF